MSHILDSMACEGCRHLRDVEDDPGTEQVAKGHSVGVPRAAIPKADSAHGAGRSEEDLYSGLSALEAARSGAGGRRRTPSDVKSLMLRTQDLAELPPEELDQRITLTWRHVGVMLHLRSTHPGIGPLELPGQWRPVTVQHLQETGERLRKYKRKYNKLRGVVPECPTVSGTSSSDSEESLQAKERRKQRNKMKRARRQAHQAAEKKQWEQQQQDLLRHIAQLQAQAAQPAAQPVQPPAPVVPVRPPAQISNEPEAHPVQPPAPVEAEAQAQQAQPPQISDQPEAQEQGRAMQPQTEESQASGQLWNDPKVCFCAGYTRGNTKNSPCALWVTDSSGTRPRLHTG